ncbi:NO signaling/Golgi transport ligand-binding domain-containing protein [Leucosporidium creatinivorum]|uniref:NO signaling/Golgi transport ligand-binding domain-containing protein n=1 Tax=Leucosporidium creatinivorum TaxID=106004 RepID=A0A1Y2FYB1_9BASI|nr:NO signaling/Golgi transport ligand-binding domain-containing protein [Leucosporidium creatinivorum]
MSNRPISALQQSSIANRSSTSLITPQLTSLSDPPTKQVDAHLLEFLTAEVIRLLIDSEAAARARHAAQEQLVEADLLAHKTGSISLKETSTARPAAEKTAAEKEEVDSAVRTRLDGMGFKVGWALSERLARDRPRFPSTPAPVSSTTPASASPLAPVPDPLETVKFICKDVWIALYDKQVDNLRTNHRGVYVLHDNAFRPLAKVSGSGDDKEVARMVQFILAFPAGVIRGALANLGISCTVSGESLGLPQSTFQIKTVKPGAV